MVSNYLKFIPKQELMQPFFGAPVNRENFLLCLQISLLCFNSCREIQITGLPPIPVDDASVVKVGFVQSEYRRTEFKISSLRLCRVVACIFSHLKCSAVCN